MCIRDSVQPASWRHILPWKAGAVPAGAAVPVSAELNWISRSDITFLSVFSFSSVWTGWGSVSYTHLDVYKRQRLQRPLPAYNRRAQHRHPLSGGCLGDASGRICHPASVSYTHLDVYKRQGQDSGKVVGGILFPLPIRGIRFHP